MNVKHELPDKVVVKEVIVDDKKAPVIKEIFAEVAKGTCTPSYIRRKYARNGFVINKNSFMDMLRNRFYIGEIFVPEYKDDKIGTIEAHYVTGLHEPIIDRDTFFAVQDLIDGKRRKTPKLTKTIHPDVYLRRYLICPVCKEPLTGGGSKGNGGKYYYYKCSRESSKHFNCSATKANDLFCKYVATLKPNTAILKLYEAILEDIYNDRSGDMKTRIVSLKGELEKQDERLASMDMMYLDKEIDKVSYDRMRKQVETTRRSLTEKVAFMEEFIRTNIEPTPSTRYST